ncbi:thermonuclease family protein [Muricoccus pecuniae]|uniref:Endonuclease YncB(Thermonuclease family) n=1 Tax=Muricoccus pecuniae TaxID=693023 RepID=A0A840Y5D6_9PROT|nr:thermonuclease family protein [Roseomonas pecuniae]MBB5696348.1 endonuclease YncB(thermonuclease family) [Roseomonas pecuniae]
MLAAPSRVVAISVLLASLLSGLAAWAADLSGRVVGLADGVRVTVQDTDRYGRTVGRVYAGPVDVNAEMVRQGTAWVYCQYSRDAELLRLETEARTARRGLWALPEAQRTPPWEWRAAERGNTLQPPR